MDSKPQDAATRHRHWGVFCTCLMHALVFAAAGVALPSKVGLGAWLLGLMALLHVIVAYMAGPGASPRWPVAFALLGRVSLIVFLVIAAFSLHAASYIAELYGGLGRGIGAVIAAMLCVVALWTLPVAFWGLSWSRTGFLGSWVPRIGLLALLGSAAMGMSKGQLSSRDVALGAPPAEKLEAALAGYVEKYAPGPVAPAMRDPGPWECPELERAKGAVLAAFGQKNGQHFATCVEIDALDQLAPQLVEKGLTGLYRLDWITHQDPWKYKADRWLAALSLRPGLDGVCMQGRCLGAWQLVALDAYRSLMPVNSIPDLRFGVSPEALWGWFGVKEGSDATRITAKSYVLDSQGRVFALSRERKTAKSVALKDLRRAKSKAQGYLLQAQRPSGDFEYMRHVFLQQALPEQLNLPRQGGTLASLCEWGQKGTSLNKSVELALASLVRHERRLESGSVLWPQPWGERADLGASALPLVALLKCRSLSQGRFDAAIGRLLFGVLQFQREDGSFSPSLSLVDQSIDQSQSQRLYSAGQAVLALVSALTEQESKPGASWPESSKLKAAASRAMNYYGQDYWSHFLGDFFFIEENWHCLAAKASLKVLPNSEYQDFCLDYLRFKHRFTLHEESRVDSAFVGGYGFGNVIVPQVTPSAGQAEALAAGIGILKARSEDTGPAMAELRSILSFLWRQQLDEVNCRGCVAPMQVQGAFTESMVSPLIRIDYVQHVFSALGAGIELLEQEGEA